MRSWLSISPRRIDGALSDLLTARRFSGKDGESAVVLIPRASPIHRIGVFGLGNRTPAPAAATTGAAAAILPALAPTTIIRPVILRGEFDNQERISI